MTHRLFVYGSLRKDASNTMVHLLGRDASFLGRASVRGRLFDLGDYPGFVLSRDAAIKVRGELYELANAIETLRELDAYEGCSPDDPEPHAYARIESAVSLDSGEQCRAWVYVYQRPIANMREIQSGDFVDETRRRSRWSSIT